MNSISHFIHWIVKFSLETLKKLYFVVLRPLLTSRSTVLYWSIDSLIHSDPECLGSSPSTSTFIFRLCCIFVIYVAVYSNEKKIIVGSSYICWYCWTKNVVFITVISAKDCKKMDLIDSLIFQCLNIMTARFSNFLMP